MADFKGRAGRACKEPETRTSTPRMTGTGKEVTGASLKRSFHWSNLEQFEGKNNDDGLQYFKL